MSTPARVSTPLPRPCDRMQQNQLEQVTLGGKQKHKYVMDLGDGEVIDASQCGSILRFVNHSCGPNAETQKWTIQDKQRIGLFAKDYIEKGEEVRTLVPFETPPPVRVRQGVCVSEGFEVGVLPRLWSS